MLSAHSQIDLSSTTWAHNEPSILSESCEHTPQSKVNRTRRPPGADDGHVHDHVHVYAGIIGASEKKKFTQDDPTRDSTPSHLAETSPITKYGQHDARHSPLPHTTRQFNLLCETPTFRSVKHMLGPVLKPTTYAFIPTPQPTTITHQGAEQHKRESDAAVKIQSWYKSRHQHYKYQCVQIMYKLDYSRQADAAVRIQRWWRAIHDKSLAQHVQSSIVAIQAFVRMAIGRRAYLRHREAVLESQRQLRDRAARVIQSRWRKAKRTKELKEGGTSISHQYPGNTRAKTQKKGIAPSLPIPTRRRSQIVTAPKSAIHRPPTRLEPLNDHSKPAPAPAHIQDSGGCLVYKSSPEPGKQRSRQEFIPCLCPSLPPSEIQVSKHLFAYRNSMPNAKSKRKTLQPEGEPITTIIALNEHNLNPLSEAQLEAVTKENTAANGAHSAVDIRLQIVRKHQPKPASPSQKLRQRAMERKLQNNVRIYNGNSAISPSSQDSSSDDVCCSSTAVGGNAVGSGTGKKRVWWSLEPDICDKNEEYKENVAEARVADEQDEVLQRDSFNSGAVAIENVTWRPPRSCLRRTFVMAPPGCDDHPCMRTTRRTKLVVYVQRFEYVDPKSVASCKAGRGRLLRHGGASRTL
ncbi:hypothetical protein SeMB42_g00543 [Synchytrium endobioticum]|uniref:Uncharacterized protein n=1 Tax=Synchytrium endobioticum TaxID=286115 RepID=A0A507DRM8_9FUNG|nr:hypothetical protein SeLEV6574_g01175 [Synchytrium endobioticum]TPX53902.1 hypothetical protein SeMB42_g00543 [Synchytrium endobioticum]